MKKLLYLLCLLILAGGLLLGFDNRLTLTEYTVTSARIPQAFDGYRIAVVSDLHARRFGARQQNLISLLRGAECDLICLSGDLVSHDTEDFAPIWELLDALQDIPMVFAAGNNELSLADYNGFLSALSQRGVVVLDDMTQPLLELHRGNSTLLLHGYPFRDMRTLKGTLPVAPENHFNILLYHDPVCFPEAAVLDYDLMLSGHIHGGVMRLPLIGSPLEFFGIEPYTKGCYTARAAKLIVSGGLGTHPSLPRFFNAPEVVLVTLISSDR